MVVGKPSCRVADRRVRQGKCRDLTLCAATAGKAATLSNRATVPSATPAAEGPYLGAWQVARVHDEVGVLQAFGGRGARLGQAAAAPAQPMQRAARGHLRSGQQLPAIQITAAHLVQQPHGKV